jgi:hypothetical protein
MEITLQFRFRNTQQEGLAYPATSAKDCRRSPLQRIDKRPIGFGGNKESQDFIRPDIFGAPE